MTAIRLTIPEHFNLMAIQPGQRHIGAMLKDHPPSEWITEDQTWTLLDDDDVPIIIAGITPIWPERAMGWALLSRDAREYMLRITRTVKRVLAVAPYRRIETTVDVDFLPGRRWAEMLGFVLEGYMHAYTPDGRDQLLYARVRHGR